MEGGGIRVIIAGYIMEFLGMVILWFITDGFVLPFIGMMLTTFGGFILGLSINFNNKENNEDGNNN